MNKVLRVGFPVDVTGFDPQALNDLYSNYINRVIFEPLLAYDYLARPYKLVPNTAAALPEITDEGRKIVVKLKKGIYFTPDPAFNGQKRELTAADYVYSWKRLLDPRVRSPNLGILEDKLVGADELVEAAKKSGKFDYDAPLPGLQALDRHTLQIRLVKPDYTLIEYMASSATSAVAREVIEKYADGSNWAINNPVGTGPYRLKEWKKGSKVVIEANPDYRDVRFPESRDAADKAVEAQMKGKKLPAIGRIEVSIIEESNPRFLAFQSKQLDFVYVPTDFVNRVIDNGKLKPEFAQQGINWTRTVQAGWTYTVFNMEDPVIGGYSREKIALRRAIGLGYNVTEEIGVLRQGQGIPATQPIPPNLPGHDPNVKRPYPYDPASARALLDRFGYKDCNGDGFRELPDCSPLVLKYYTDSTEISRQFSELWKKSMDAIGIKIEFVLQKWPDTLKAAKAGKVMMWGWAGWQRCATGSSSCRSCTASTSIIRTFRASGWNRTTGCTNLHKHCPTDRSATRSTGRCPTILSPTPRCCSTPNRIDNALVYPWVQGWKMHSFSQFPFVFLDIDANKQKAALK